MSTKTKPVGVRSASKYTYIQRRRNEKSNNNQARMEMYLPFGPPEPRAEHRRPVPSFKLQVLYLL